MTQPKLSKWLSDILEAGDFIARYTANQTLDDYDRDELLRSAVQRRFEIIGEALRRIARAEPDVAARITDYRSIIDFRNVLAHGYDLVNHAQVWHVIHHLLPMLQTEVAQLLREADEDQDELGNA
ncbi:MAG: DUF86 domain-containing protein [Chloroflexia bacterium]|nr:DUF86 domain-containing protein [Chloroflexia bacterium]